MRGSKCLSWMGLCFAVICVVSADAEAKGSHFLLELNNGLSRPIGYSDGYDYGYALGGTVGVGGKFRGNPLRFYIVGNFNTSGFNLSRSYNNKVRIVTRQVTDLSLGLRMLVPLQGRLRGFVEGSLGQAQVDGLMRIQGGPPQLTFRDTDTDFAVFLGGGLQYRLSYHVSLGTKLDIALIDDDDSFDPIEDTFSDESPNRTGRVNLYLTGTVHF